MRFLVTYGSKRGGTEGLARMVGAALREAGMDADVRPPWEVDGIAGYDSVIVGGALYADRWHRRARQFVKAHARDLRGMPVWFFSSGPLDPTAATKDIPPTRQVQRLMDLVHARGHVTFGGRLDKDAKGFIARAMARTMAGDFRDPQHVRRWIADVVSATQREKGRAARPELRPT